MLVNLVNATITEGRDSRMEVPKILLNYQNTIHPNTVYSPVKLIIGRSIKIKILYLRKQNSDKVEQAKKQDKTTQKEERGQSWSR